MKQAGYVLLLIGRPFYRLISWLLGKLVALVCGVRLMRTGWFYGAVGLVFLSLSIAGWLFYSKIFVDLPDVNQILNPPLMSTKVYDRNGKLLYRFYRNEDRTWIPLGVIPQSLVEATLAIEDKDYYKHGGVSIKGIAAAMWHDLKKDGEDNLRGGSTITQQLVKNVFFSNQQTWKRKISEILMSIILERKLSKDQILERYFNQVAYGGETYGVEEAAEKYFGKHVAEISDSEATLLAGIPAAPSSYSPYGTNKDLVWARQRRVVFEMIKAGFVDQKRADEILSNKVVIKNDTRDIKASHFVFYIKDWLEEKYGIKDIDRLGLRIVTSLDIDNQMMAEKIVKEEVDKAKGLRIGNGAALVIDVSNGDILAMVGSKDYNATDIDGKYNVTTAYRQPGSSIKPINYLVALQHGLSLASMIDDSPVTYNIAGQKPYSPQNYNGKFMGWVPVKVALASSLNVPSVKLLAENGVNNMIDMAEKLGITTWGDRSRFGLSLALGAGEVKMVELAGAYAVFADMGQRIEINPILSIGDYLGETIYQKEVVKKQIIEPGYAFLINDILSDNEARTPIFGPNSMLRIDNKMVAVKTGTTNSLKDNWCIGWTPEVLVAAWVGNNDGTPMSWVASGISGATPIWNRIMREMIKNRPNKEWQPPAGVYKKAVCGKEEYFMSGTENGVRCPTRAPTPTPGSL